MSNNIFIISSQKPVPFIKEKVKDVQKDFAFPVDFTWTNDYHYSFILSFNSSRADKEIAVSYTLNEKSFETTPVNSVVHYSKDKVMESIIYFLAVYNLFEKSDRCILYYEYRSEDTEIAQLAITKWIENVNKLRKA